MNRTFYFYANYFLGLGSAASVVEGILRLMAGRQTFFLDGFIPWLTLPTILFVAGSLFILKYYRHKAHNIWNDVEKTPGVLDWLFAQKRESTRAFAIRRPRFLFTPPSGCSPDSFAPHAGFGSSP